MLKWTQFTKFVILALLLILLLPSRMIASDPAPSPSPAINSDVVLNVNVVNSSGQPLSGAYVTIIDASHYNKSQHSNSQGVANFVNLMEGDAQINASKQGYNDSSGLSTTLIQGINNFYIYLTADKPPQTGIVYGKVFSNNAEGVGAGSTMKPIVGAAISINEDGVNYTAVTDNNGAYQISGLKINNNANILVAAPGYISQTIQDYIPTYRLERIFYLQSDGSGQETKSNLSGHVVFNKSQLVYPGTTVTLTQFNQTLSTTADASGSYSFANLKPGYVKISATNMGVNFAPKDVFLKIGSNVYDINLSALALNKITGSAKYNNGSYANGIIVKIFEKQTHSLVGSTIVYFGEYEYGGRNLRKDVTYVIEPWKQSGQIVGTTAEVTFSADLGEEKVANLKVTQSLTYKYNLQVMVVDKKTQDKISNAKVIIKESYSSRETTASTDRDGVAKYNNIDSGYYSVIAMMTGYKTEIDGILLTDQPDSKGNLMIVQLHRTFINSSDCIQHPQSNVKNFWFCGNAAKQLYTSRPTTWPSIDAQIGQLRSLSSNYAVLPLQIVISSDKYVNAGYHDPKEISNACQMTLNPTADAAPDYGQEYIILTKGMLDIISDKEVDHIVTHEFGHGTDVRRENKCSLFDSMSGQDPFYALRRFGALYADYFLMLKDGVYDPEHSNAGHPADNSMETWASAFHDGILHLDEFKSNANSYSDPLKSILLETERIAVGQ